MMKDLSTSLTPKGMRFADTKIETLKKGVVGAGGNGTNPVLNQLTCPRDILVDTDHSVYVSDFNNRRLLKWAKDAREGLVVAGGQGQGKKDERLSFPSEIFVDRMGSMYIADQGNDRVMH